MKRSKSCPKCQSDNIMHIEDMLYLTNNTGIKTGWLKFAAIEVYICGACGFFEQNIKDQDDLAKIKKYYGE